MASVYNCDEHGTEVSYLKWTQELTAVCDFLEVSFTNAEHLDFYEGSHLTWNGVEWRVLSSRWVYTGSIWQCSALCVPPSALLWVDFDYTESEDLYSRAEVEVVVGASHKYPLCIKGDTLAVVLRRQNNFSLVQNQGNLSAAYCDYISYNGAYVRRWADMVSNVVQFTSGMTAFDVKVEYVDSHDLYAVQHTPIGLPWDRATYEQYLFGDRVEVRSGLLAEMARGYNLSSFGFDTGKAYVLVKQVYEPRSGSLPFHQFFAEVRGLGDG